MNASSAGPQQLQVVDGVKDLQGLSDQFVSKYLQGSSSALMIGVAVGPVRNFIN
jgi:hypothetical protein